MGTLFWTELDQMIEIKNLFFASQNNNELIINIAKYSFNIK